MGVKGYHMMGADENMFGRRNDGRLITNIDPIVRFTPYIMPRRYDAMCETRQELDFDGMTRYIKAKRAEGHNDITYMSIIIAAYVRMLCDIPEMNRFVVNKKLYARNHFCVSFITLKKTESGEPEEAVCKVKCDLRDTIFDVSKRLEAAIEEGRKPEEKNATDKLAQTLVKVPGLPTFIVWLARRLDNLGILPKLIYDASPFHTSLFISNMASIGMNYVYHHIYDFGTTSIFVTMGKPEQHLSRNADGTCRAKRVMPMGCVIDERVASGASYAQMFATTTRYINEPELLEKPPEHVKTEIEMEAIPKA